MQLELDKYRSREANLIWKEKQAKQKLKIESVHLKRKVVERELFSMNILRMKEIQLGHIFRKAEDHMRNVIGRQEVRT